MEKSTIMMCYDSKILISNALFGCSENGKAIKTLKSRILFKLGPQIQKKKNNNFHSVGKEKETVYLNQTRARLELSVLSNLRVLEKVKN
jgi:hypothetical protein